MIRKLIAVWVMTIMGACMTTMQAQSMTDAQVIQYVSEQQARGSDQQTIVSRLLQRGVTVQQLQRIRKNLEAEKSQLGAVDLNGQNTTTTPSRLRTNQQLAGEQYQQQNNYMVRSQARGNNGQVGYTRDERLQMMNNDIAFLDIDSLMYYRNKFNDEDQVFGRNIFNTPTLTFQPNMNIATPANYRLGAGDAVIIDVWGASQETFEGTLSPDGTVTIPGVGPINLGGMTVAQANSQLKSRLGRYYADSDIKLTVGNTRAVTVQVIGEVKMPGSYTLNSLSTAFNALYAAGGISDIGTLRNIKVYRQGRQIATIDVYDYIINGNASGDVRLQDNDIVSVGPYEQLVRIKGRVKRPMFYEMKPTESVSTILNYAGGFAGDAYRKNVRLIRKSGAEYSIHTIDEFDMNGFRLSDGDSIYVDSVVARYSNMAEVRGAVFHPGMYQIGGEINSVRSLIAAAEGLRDDAFAARGVMHRQRPDMTLEVISFDVKALIEGSAADIPLQKNDVVFIPSRSDYITNQTIKISGEVVYPGTYQYAEGTTIEDFILQAGGLTNSASTSKVDVFRPIFDPTSTEKTNDVSETFSFSIKDGFVIDGTRGFTLQPFDEVVVRRSPSYSTMQTVTVSGSVNFEGQYSVTNKNYRLSDLITAAGGITELAYTKGARLERRMTEEERQLNEAMQRKEQIALYEEAMRNERNYDMAKADSLLSLKLDVSNTMSVAIDLEAALANPGCPEDIALREGDRLVVPQYVNTVQISGDVLYPITVNYKKGESLDYYIKSAGGYGENARKKNVYILYANGSAQQLGHHSSKDIEPGSRIVVPSKNAKNKMTVAEYSAMGTSAASIATMMVTIANILK